VNAESGNKPGGSGDRPPFGRLVNVTKTFETGGQPVQAVKDVSLQFAKGELISLLGPSGCGKTTVLKMIGGLIPPSGGLLELDGKAIAGPFPGVGMAFQAPTLMPWRSVLANVLFPMEVLGRNDRKARNRAREILELVGLAGFEQAYPRQLSGGMQQRVALCRAIIHEPSLLLMDEPCSISGASPAQPCCSSPTVSPRRSICRIGCSCSPNVPQSSSWSSTSTSAIRARHRHVFSNSSPSSSEGRVSRWVW
jgi:ABC-type lipoprotein export system ATPase subunit